MIFKRMISAITCAAVLASSLSVFSGCSMKDILGEPNKATAESGVITNGEWLKMVNDAFGLQVDENAENGELDAAKAWGVIGDDEEVDEDAPVDDKFIASTLTKAAGFVDRNASDEEIINAAIQHKLITSPDTEITAQQDAVVALAKAQQEWSHPVFEEKRDIELIDNVENFTDNMNPNDVKFEGDVITIPSAYASSLQKDSVAILPRNEEGKGGGYKVISISDNGDGTSSIKCVPAKVEEIYKKIDVAGNFGADFSTFKPADSSVKVVSEPSAAENNTISPVGCKEPEEGMIKPLGYAEEASVEQLSVAEGTGWDPGITIQADLNDKCSVSVGVTDIIVNARVDYELCPVAVNEIFCTVDYDTTVSFEYGWDQDDADYTDFILDEPKLPLGEVYIPICEGLSVKLSLDLTIEASGKVSVTITTSNCKGFDFINGQFAAINESSETSELAVTGQVGAYANATIALTLGYSVVSLDLLSLQLKIGPTLKGEVTFHGHEGEDDFMMCVDINGYLTTEAKVVLLEQIFKAFNMEASATLIEDSPENALIHWTGIHFENFQYVDHCTFDEDDDTTTTTAPSTNTTGTLEIDKDYLTLTPGSSTVINVTSLPSGYTEADLVWTVSDGSRLHVDNQGNVTGMNPGAASVTIKTSDGRYEVHCPVNVIANTQLAYDSSDRCDIDAVSVAA